MLDSRGSNRLDLAYMPYHEGLMNHNAPPVRGSLSVRVPPPQHSQSMPTTSYYGDSDDDDDVSDDPAWMNAPRGSLQPALPANLMKKASSISVTDTQASSPVSPSTDELTYSGEEEDDQDKQRKHKKDDDDDDDDDDYFRLCPRCSRRRRRSRDARTPRPLAGAATISRTS